MDFKALKIECTEIMSSADDTRVEFAAKRLSTCFGLILNGQGSATFLDIAWDCFGEAMDALNSYERDPRPIGVFPV